MNGHRRSATSGAALRRGVPLAVCGVIAILLAGCSDDTNVSDRVGAPSSVAPAATEPAAAAEAALAESAPGPGKSTQPSASPTSATPTVEDGDQVAGQVATSASPGSSPLPSVPGPTVVAASDEEASFGTGVVARVDSVESVDVEGRIPGEVSGPGVVVTIIIDNDSSETISLDFVTVDLLVAEGASAPPVELNPPGSLRGELEPGQSATGLYQFVIPVGQRSAATLTVSYTAAAPTALFTGGLPDA